MTTPPGVSLAFDDPALEPAPSWTRLDEAVTRVASYTIDRGRQYELDTTDGGRATVVINDEDGTLDPTNPSGPYYGKIEPLLQASIARWNPVLEEWQSRFRGFVADYDYVFNPSQRVNQLTVNLVDMWEILTAIEMQPGIFGDPPPVGSEGQVFFDNANVDDRIIQVQGNAGIPDDFFVVFSGNVGLYETTYSPGESALAAIQEAADAEFPGVSNLYPDRFGRVCFHGRLAKFDPSGTEASAAYTAWSGATAYLAGDRVSSGGHAYQCILNHTNHVPPNVTYWTEIPKRWDFQEWKAGDGEAVSASIGDTAQIRQFAFNRGLAKIINQAYATPPEIIFTAAELAGQLAQDLTSIGLRGIRSWSRQNLLTKTGLLDSSDALTETKRFADYYIANYADPNNRITTLAFRPMRPDDSRAAASWKLLCQADIADSISVTIESPGGGGFEAETFFIEGVHEEVVGRIGQDYDDVTMTLDVSPRAFFTSNPFPVA